jgi:hypothetical protein
VLEQRLRGRGQDPEDEIARRLGEAKADCAHFTEYTYTVINDDFATALADLESIFRANRLRTADQERRQHGHPCWRLKPTHRNMKGRIQPAWSTYGAHHC